MNIDIQDLKNKHFFISVCIYVYDKLQIGLGLHHDNKLLGE